VELWQDGAKPFTIVEDDIAPYRARSAASEECGHYWCGFTACSGRWTSTTTARTPDARHQRLLLQGHQDVMTVAATTPYERWHRHGDRWSTWP
jgi:hypothetical protein